MRASKVEALLADGSLLLRDAHPCSKKMDSSVTGILSSVMAYTVMAHTVMA